MRFLACHLATTQRKYAICECRGCFDLCAPSGRSLGVRFAGRRDTAVHEVRRGAPLFVSVVSLGRFSFVGGCFRFPPCLRPLPPFRVRNLQHFSLATAADTRPYALTLNPLRLTHEKRSALFGCSAVRSPLTRFSLRRAPAAFHLAGVRAPCGHTRPATQPTLARRARYFVG